ncbi:MAG: spermine/spermidine synthase domain-containing protein [Actinomycetota bacterium]
MTGETTTLEPSREARTSFLGERAGLILASFVMLFAELALIRWVAAYQIHVAYFTNFILLASFLGIGVGFLRARASRSLHQWAPLALAAYALFVFALRVVKGIDPERNIHTAFGLPAPPSWVVLPLLFLGAAFAMALVAEEVARRFERFEPLEAYRLDITGSLLGIIAFSTMSFLRIGPLLWGVVLAVSFLLLAPGRPSLREHPRRAVGSLALLVVFALGSLAPLDTWSPYYRVTVYPIASDGRIGIRANSLPHQSIWPVERLAQEFYASPYAHLGDRPVGDVLIVGAGSGNDVAYALSQGASSVDAVEIDPVLQETGRDHHPAHPYQDPRVTVHIDDGRAFLQRSDQAYDLILFALPDSLTLVSGQGALRLESYLFTREAMEAVRDHLAPGGIFAMYNYYRPDVFARYANTMNEVWGHEPCYDEGDPGGGSRSQAVLTVGMEPGDAVCDVTYPAAADAPEPATDDHPFPYVRGRTIPSLYLWWLAAIVLMSLVVIRWASGGPISAMRPYVDLFCMGAAFLLLETKAVVQFALLFGTTWFVNSLVFAGILLAVLGAIELARRGRLPSPLVLYGLLLVCLGVAWVIQPGDLLPLAPAPRFLAGVAVAFAPVFVANLIFAQRFRGVGASTVAFGANLLGAMVGGVLEYTAIMTGYRNLLLLVALLYGLAMVFGRRHLGRATAPAPAAAP